MRSGYATVFCQAFGNSMLAVIRLAIYCLSEPLVSLVELSSLSVVMRQSGLPFKWVTERAGPKPEQVVSSQRKNSGIALKGLRMGP